MREPEPEPTPTPQRRPTGARRLPEEARRALTVALRRDARLTTLALILHLAGGAVAAATMRQEGAGDWWLYALMGLATAVILTNFARLAPSAGLPRRIASGGFAALVVAAWAALLADRAAPIAIGAATVGRARPALWIAVGCEAAVVLLLLGHLLLVAPRTRLARRAPPP